MSTSRSSFTGIGRELRKMFPFSSTVRLLILGGGSFGLFAADGRLMAMSFTAGAVVMMKMTNSTNARSSSGVMFNSLIV